jgi:hypothetical protein
MSGREPRGGRRNGRRSSPLPFDAAARTCERLDVRIRKRNGYERRRSAGLESDENERPRSPPGLLQNVDVAETRLPGGNTKTAPGPHLDSKRTKRYLILQFSLPVGLPKRASGQWRPRNPSLCLPAPTRHGHSIRAVSGPEVARGNCNSKRHGGMRHSKSVS